MTASHIFLSYAKEDAEHVRRVQVRLQKDGFTVWRDEYDLLPGEDWDNAIREAIRSSKVFVILLSERAVSKTGYVQREIREALEVAQLMPPGKVFILPVRLAECSLPKDLSRWQCVDLFRRGGHERLRQGLRAHVGISQPESSSLLPPTFAAPADHLLYDLLKRSGRIVHAHLKNGRYAIGQGHFYVIRSDFPREFFDLGSHVADFRQVPGRRVTDLLIRPSSWRRDRLLVSSNSHL